MDAPVLVEARDGFRILTLNRPDRLNAFNDALHAALRAAIDDADRDPGCRALVLTGAGRAFSSGQDLSERHAMLVSGAAPDLAKNLETNFNPLVSRIRGLRLPVVAAVNGIAAGAGCNVALACDLVVAARSARLTQSFVRVGLVPDSGGTWMLPRLVGDARARALALLGDALGAEDAEQIGLIHKAVDDAQLMTAAAEIATRLAAQPASAIAAIKRAFAASPASPLDRQLDLERDLQAALGRSADYREGVLAFVEKRPAQFNRRS